MMREKKLYILREKLKDKITRDIKALHTKKERTIRDIITLFEQEEYYYDPKSESNF